MAYTYNKEYLLPNTIPFYLIEKWNDSQAGKEQIAEMTPHSPKSTEKASGITICIYRRTPGKGKLDTLKPSYRSHEINPQTGESVLVYSQYNTVIYEFKVFHYDYDKLIEVQTELEEFLFYMNGDLQSRFVENFLFFEQIDATLLNTQAKSEESYLSVLRYIAYPQKLYKLSYPQLQKILLTAQVKDNETYLIEKSITRSNKRFDIILDKKSIFCPVIRVSDTPKSLVNPRSEESIYGKLYLPDIDYVQHDHFDPQTNKTISTIVWLSKVDTKSPLFNENYYVEYLTATEVNTSLE